MIEGVVALLDLLEDGLEMLFDDALYLGELPDLALYVLEFALHLLHVGSQLLYILAGLLIKLGLGLPLHLFLLLHQLFLDQTVLFQ